MYLGLFYKYGYRQTAGILKEGTVCSLCTNLYYPASSYRKENTVVLSIPISCFMAESFAVEVNRGSAVVSMPIHVVRTVVATAVKATR
jgi:hypothetical protein